MTTAGALITAMTLPILIGQFIYAISRGKPARNQHNSPSTMDS